MKSLFVAILVSCLLVVCFAAERCFDETKIKNLRSKMIKECKNEMKEGSTQLDKTFNGVRCLLEKEGVYDSARDQIDFDAIKKLGEGLATTNGLKAVTGMFSYCRVDFRTFDMFRNMAYLCMNDSLRDQCSDVSQLENVYKKMEGSSSH